MLSQCLNHLPLKCGRYGLSHTHLITRGYKPPNTQPLLGKILAIRREDQSVWERRAPLSPANVRKLVGRGARVLVQPSNRRAYPMQAYAAVGAEIQEDISEAPVIIGVKQVPVDSLIPNKTYCFFSHTIKAQEANMGLLDAVLEKNIRLLDYEKLVDESGQRIVAFGKWAGVAGMINILHGLGLRLLALGHHTPFMHIGPAHNYRNSGMAMQAIRDAGYEISLGMMPKSIGPITLVFTGSGNVSQGAQEVFQQLPYEFVPPDMLKKVAEHGATNKLYACAVRRQDHLVRTDGGPFDPEEYDQHPERYYSTFSKKIAPYASVLVNGIFWNVNSPKLLTIPDAKILLRPTSTPWLASSVGCPTLPHRLLAICDISADPGGSIEFMTECTTIDTPFCLYDADQHKSTESFAGPGVLVCSIDNMPTQLPTEATDFFGNLVFPYILEVIKSDATRPLDDEKFSAAVHGALIASNGKLTPNFEYIQELRQANRMKSKGVLPSSKQRKHKALVLGAGFVSAPAVDYLTRDNDISVTIASALKAEADTLAKRYLNCESTLLDVVDRQDLLEDLIKDANVVISLLPYSLHPTIAELCIKYRVNMVTASYTSPKMKSLHQSAVESGITVMNEIGLDPGIDHLLAMECFDEVRRQGGKITSFVSYCGGLPAPEHSENPLRYKFSWSPKGALINAQGSAKFKQDGKIIDVPEGSLMDYVTPVGFLPGFNLEGYPNRDSTSYIDQYNIHEAKTVFRGSLRYKGYGHIIKGFMLLGLLDSVPHPCLHPKGPDLTWKQFMCTVLGINDHSIFVDNLKYILYTRLGNDSSRLEAMESLGFLSDDLIFKMNTPVDTVSHYLGKKLQYCGGERDLVVMRHNIGILWPDGKKEVKAIDMVVYGHNQSVQGEADAAGLTDGAKKGGGGGTAATPGGFSAMAKTVGFPAGIAAKMILEGEIQRKGMVVPMTADMYVPILKRLKQEDIYATETSTFV